MGPQISMYREGSGSVRQSGQKFGDIGREVNELDKEFRPC